MRCVARGSNPISCGRRAPSGPRWCSGIALFCVALVLSAFGLVSLVSMPLTGGAGAVGAGAGFGGALVAMTLGRDSRRHLDPLSRRAWLAGAARRQGDVWLTPPHGASPCSVCWRHARGLRPEGPALSTRCCQRGGDTARRHAAGLGGHRGAKLSADRGLAARGARARSGSHRPGSRTKIRRKTKAPHRLRRNRRRS